MALVRQRANPFDQRLQFTFWKLNNGNCGLQADDKGIQYCICLGLTGKPPEIVIRHTIALSKNNSIVVFQLRARRLDLSRLT